jgi:hypothetical protein
MGLDTESGRRPAARKRSNRAFANAIRSLFVAVVTLLALLALSPQEWAGKLGAWASFLIAHRVHVLVLLVLLLAGLWFKARQPFVTRLEYISQSEYGGITDMAPVGIQSRVVGILDRLGQPGHSRTHIARIIFLTGRSTLNYLDQVVDKHRTRSDWDIRVLILDPESAAMDKLGPGRKQEAIASCAQLASIKHKIVSRTRPAKLSWRGFSDLPMVRGFLIDDEHLFFGYFEWQNVDGGWQLHEQNKTLVYARRGDHLSVDSIEFFKSWFDYRWETGRNLDNLGA